MLPRVIDTRHPPPTKAEQRTRAEASKERYRLWLIFQEGMAAYNADLARRSVPYPPASPDRRAWIDGWNSNYRHWKRQQKGKRRRGDYSAWPPL